MRLVSPHIYGTKGQAHQEHLSSHDGAFPTISVHRLRTTNIRVESKRRATLIWYRSQSLANTPTNSFDRMWAVTSSGHAEAATDPILGSRACAASRVPALD